MLILFLLYYYNLICVFCFHSKLLHTSTTLVKEGGKKDETGVGGEPVTTSAIYDTKQIYVTSVNTCHTN